MADEDEIDVLGDFSFNSCFAQNSQGIPSCSDREDTVHPQWLLDSPATNWYDTQNIDKNRLKEGPSRKLSGHNTTAKYNTEQHTTWTQLERDLLKTEMIKYGRNVKKIARTIKTKTEAEIQALIEAEHGILLDTSHDLEKLEEDIPVVHEEIVSESLVSMSDVLNIVTTGVPTIPVTKKPFKKKNVNRNLKNTQIKPKAKIQPNIDTIDSAELYFEDDLVVGSTESVGSESDVTQSITKKTFKQQKEKVTAMKKIGNHRRKVSRNYDKGRSRNKSSDNLKSPQGRQRKDSSLSNDTVKSPQMQIVLGSGLALPVSEGEEVIKIEKKDTECESDIEVDIDSDKESSPVKVEEKKQEKELEGPIAVPLRKFEPMPKRNRKINLDGGGGYTIMHTESGDLYEIGQEPRKERQQKKPVINLIPCRFYNAEKPAPCEVSLHVSALLHMDAHAHSSRAEVMGLLGGRWAAPRLRLRLYRRVRAVAAPTHCDMEPVSQARAADWLRARGAAVCAWHHSHPRFPAAPSAQDLRSQHALQAALRWPAPFLALVTSQHWPPGRRASTLRCFRVEEYDEAAELPVGYQLSVKLVPDLTAGSLPEFLRELRDLLCNFSDRNRLSVDMVNDVCPQAGLTYLEKCISSVRHHMHSAGYEDDDPLIEQLIQGIRDIFR
ncbi:uncharacterized protein LOC124529574 isoform X1 [Vanessa cardui]|uniref:uncharacterized protein LOC124529574 isoform X1 n=1 Tax=Vanessa cardui TaxID=171605 RepID=UPI001F13A509|nr:uncharacterized protein LOC124529574 isoform X1 [Vanessa cardui]